MRIVEKIKDVVEHTTDSWQQKLLNEYSHGDEPATRARKIISELVRPLDKPNQVIINDIVSLIYALASNPDPSIDLEQIISTAQLLIHELVDPIPNPDKRLMDELLNIVIHAAHAPKQRAGQMGTNIPQVSMTMNQNAPVSVQSDQQSQSAKPMPNQSPIAAKEPTQSQSAAMPSQNSSSSSSSKTPIDQSMIKLIMDQMKEVIKKNQNTEQRINETENKLTGRLSSTFDDIQTMKDKIKKQEADLETINKNLDKFISLYEIVINQYNPFIEHIDDPKKKETAPVPQTPSTVASAKTATPPQMSASTLATQAAQEKDKAAAESSAIDSTSAASDQDNLSVIIEEVKKMNDADFLSGKDKMSKWIRSVIKDETLAQAYLQAKAPQEAVKVLLKKSLQMHMTDTKNS